jgi:hypothetical protein
VRIDAGYDEPERIFTGDLRWGSSKLENVDWVTSLLLGDGDRAYRNARVNKSYKPGVNVLDAVVDAAKAMGLEMPKNVFDIKSLRQTFVKGLTLNGKAKNELTRLLKTRGVEWSIQDGRFQAIREQDVRDEPAFLISQDTGLVGVPELAAPSDAKKKPVLTAEMLLFPRLTPGSLVVIQSREIEGQFKVERVTHTGDTHGDAWHTKIEATPR